MVAVVVAAVAGLLIGSFLTVVIDRVPRGASVVRPGSACGSCGTSLVPLDLVPVVSWVVRRGRCGHCGARIGWDPLLVELATAAVFVAFAVEFDSAWTIAAHCVLGAALVAQTAIDLRTTRLPREVTYTAIAAGLPLLAIASVVHDEPRRIALAIGGAALATAIMAVIHLGSRGGMGEGDVRLAPLLGLYLGWQNPGIVPLGLFTGFLFGAVVGVALIVAGRGGRRTALPFGPFLALGTFVAVFAGQDMVDLVLAR